MQGVNFICPFIPFAEIGPLGNLWFITIILLCYLLTIILKNFEKKHNVSVVGATVVLLFIWLVPKILMCFPFRTLIRNILWLILLDIIFQNSM